MPRSFDPAGGCGAGRGRGRRRGHGTSVAHGGPLTSQGPQLSFGVWPCKDVSTRNTAPLSQDHMQYAVTCHAAVITQSLHIDASMLTRLACMVLCCTVRVSIHAQTRHAQPRDDTATHVALRVWAQRHRRARCCRWSSGRAVASCPSGEA